MFSKGKVQTAHAPSVLQQGSLGKTHRERTNSSFRIRTPLHLRIAQQPCSLTQQQEEKDPWAVEVLRDKISKALAAP